jgi:hypothetical protein
MTTPRNSIFFNVRTDRQFRASTGLSLEEFNHLSVIFSKYYLPKTYFLSDTYSVGHVIQDPSEALFFILYFKKTYPTYDILGLSFGFSNKTAHDYVQKLKLILKQCLQEEETLPARVFENEEEQKEFFKNTKEIIVDATERMTQRPSNEDVQKERYSGKKNFTP